MIKIDRYVCDYVTPPLFTKGREVEFARTQLKSMQLSLEILKEQRDLYIDRVPVQMDIDIKTYKKLIPVVSGRLGGLIAGVNTNIRK